MNQVILEHEEDRQVVKMFTAAFETGRFILTDDGEWIEERDMEKTGSAPGPQTTRTGDGPLEPAKRTFDTGATRDTEEGKYDYEAFLSPMVLERFAEYLHKHRKMADGSVRDGDNWQKGIPKEVYMKSAWRHFHAWWTIHRTPVDKQNPGHAEALQEALCAVMFNAMGFLHEELKTSGEWNISDD